MTLATATRVLTRGLRRLGLEPVKPPPMCVLDVAPHFATLDGVRFKRLRKLLLVRGIAGGRRVHVWIRLRGPVCERLERAVRVGFGYLNIADGDGRASIRVTPAIVRSLSAALEPVSIARDAAPASGVVLQLR